MPITMINPEDLIGLPEEVKDQIWTKAMENTLTRYECDIAFEIVSKSFFRNMHMKDIHYTEFTKIVDFNIECLQKIFDNKVYICNKLTSDEIHQCVEWMTRIVRNGS